jgi:hypothetical protein
MSIGKCVGSLRDVGEGVKESLKMNLSWGIQGSVKKRGRLFKKKGESARSRPIQ